MKNGKKPVIERTLILVKPDGVARGLTGEILNRFERKGLQIVAARLIKPSLDLAQKHYAEHAGSGAFFDAMCAALTCGPNLAVILEGELAVKASRQVIGFASPIDQSPIGTIRGDFAIYEPKNLVHGSDSAGAAKREITLWFDESYLIKKQPVVATIAADVTPGGFWAPPKKVQPPVEKHKFKNHVSAIQEEINSLAPTFAAFSEFIGEVQIAENPVILATDLPENGLFSKFSLTSLADSTGFYNLTDNTKV